MLCFLVTVGIAQANWYEDSAWVNSLTGEEQNVVLLLISTDLNQNLMNTVYKNALKNSTDRLWMSKVEAIGKNMISNLATNSPEMRKAMKDGSVLLVEFIRGEIPVEKYTKLSEENQKALRNIIDGLDIKNAEKIATKYKLKIEKTSKSLIANAKYVSVK